MGKSYIPYVSILEVSEAKNEMADIIGGIIHVE
jgi:hypothetical protein